MPTPSEITIPASLLPADGRFGSGPSRVRPAQLATLSALGATVMGTSHRQPPVRDLVRRARSGIAQLLGAPSGYEVLLGNGGSTAFWDAATFGLVRSQAHHAVYGEFSGKFASATAAAPFLRDSRITRSEPGTLAIAEATAGVDVVAWAHNETSTGVVAPVVRPSWGGEGEPPLALVDATSIAGAAPVDLTQTDVYYFAPQKVFGADGGLWLAICSPRAIARIEEIAGSERWIPESLSLAAALANSRQDQTLNTPAVATLILLVDQIEWILGNGGLDWAASRSRESSSHLYAWAERRTWASPFVAQPSHRSPVVATIDLAPEVSATEVIRVLREHGILDVFPYRKLGRNQLRVGVFPAVEPSDVRALTECIDHVVAQLLG